MVQLAVLAEMAKSAQEQFEQKSDVITTFLLKDTLMVSGDINEASWKLYLPHVPARSELTNIRILFVHMPGCHADGHRVGRRPRTKRNCQGQNSRFENLYESVFGSCVVGVDTRYCSARTQDALDSLGEQWFAYTQCHRQVRTQDFDFYSMNQEHVL